MGIFSLEPPRYESLFTTLLFLLTAVGSFAQQCFTVSGRLLDAQRQPVAFAALALLAADSSIVASTQSSAAETYQLTGGRRALSRCRPWPWGLPRAVAPGLL